MENLSYENMQENKEIENINKWKDGSYYPRKFTYAELLRLNSIEREKTRCRAMSIYSYFKKLVKEGNNHISLVRFLKRFKRYHEKYGCISNVTLLGYVDRLKDLDLLKVEKINNKNHYSLNEDLSTPIHLKKSLEKEQKIQEEIKAETPKIEEENNEDFPKTGGQDLWKKNTENRNVNEKVNKKTNIKKDTQSVDICQSTEIFEEPKETMDNKNTYTNTMYTTSEIVAPVELAVKAKQFMQAMGIKNKKLISMIVDKIRYCKVNRAGMVNYIKTVIFEKLAEFEVMKENYKKFIKSKKSKQLAFNQQSNQKEFDYDTLEKQLLGWE